MVFNDFTINLVLSFKHPVFSYLNFHLILEIISLDKGVATLECFRDSIAHQFILLISWSHKKIKTKQVYNFNYEKDKSNFFPLKPEINRDRTRKVPVRL